MAGEMHRSLSLELDVEPGGAISGRVSGDGQKVDFIGWLGLATALESFFMTPPIDSLRGAGPAGANPRSSS